MSKEKRRVPKLRFPGFTEDWEQRKFKDIAFKRGKISEADLPYVEFEDINSGIGTLNKNISQKVGHKKGLLFEAGDVLFGKLRPYLQNWLLCQFAGIAVGDFWVLQPQNVSSAFLYYLIQSEAYQSVANISSGTKMPRSSWPLVSETLFSIPKYKEANMIGEFFLLIDRTITLHQRKLDNLKLKKKALLQKLFPKNGERYPELRFPGFTDAWEQRKLGEVVKSYSGGTPTASNKEYYGGDIPFIRSAEINSDTTELYITQKGLDNSSAKIVEKGTILYAMYGATSGEVGISKINGAINQAILAMIPLDYNGKIIAQYLRKNKESIIGKYLQGGQGNLSANIILELPIQLPGLEESNQIANFLESFDKIITLHQRKLDHLQLQKKALLQQMFV